MHPLPHLHMTPRVLARLDKIEVSGRPPGRPTRRHLRKRHEGDLHCDPGHDPLEISSVDGLGVRPCWAVKA